MSGRAISSEPAVDWHRLVNPAKNRNILQQLGVGLDSQDFEKRGILDLNILSHPVRSHKYENDTMPDPILDNALSFSGSYDWNMRDDVGENMASNVPDQAPHAAHTSVFQGIFQETGDPALAMHALVFRIYQMTYYDWQQSFDLRDLVTTIRSTSVLIPVQWTGFIIVIGMLGVHFVLLSLTIALFALRTRISLLGNAWQAVLQLVSPPVQEMVNEGDCKTDKEVKEWAKSTGVDSGMYGLSRSVSSGRTGIEAR